MYPFGLILYIALLRLLLMNDTKKPSGIFICHCGGNISDTIDIKQLKDSFPDCKVFDYEYLCSNRGQQYLKDEIEHSGLERVIVGACTPAKHENLFKNCASKCGINQEFLKVVNLREQCSWVHADSDRATYKAFSMLNSGMLRLLQAQPVEQYSLPINPDALVIGGGIAGINAALNLANSGVHTYLVEKETTIGGNAAKIGKIFSPEKLVEECAMCSLSPLMNEVASHPNIELLTDCEIRNIDSTTGNFQVSITQNPRYVTEKCVCCGKCSAVCPVVTENEFNCGSKDKKAISIKFAQAVPQIYSINPEHCIELKGGRCGKCREVCNVDAIDFSQQDKHIEIQVGAIIAATGFDEYDPSSKPQYGYGRFPNVLTQLELARLLGVNGPTQGKLLRPSDARKPENIVMIQCVGSRDEKSSGNRYCSRYCCMAALKHASLIKKKYPDVNVTICYIDMRAFGLYENYYRAVQEMGVQFVRGRPAEIAERNNSDLVVKVEDTLNQQLMELPADMVVLSAAMEPSEGTQQIARIMDTNLSEDGFIKERHSKLRPVDTSKEGIFVCGSAQSPKDITDSIAQSGLAASRAHAFLAAGEIYLDPHIAVADPGICTLCGKCVTCPFGAISIEDKVKIDPLVCNGCGYCTYLCDEGAIHVRGYSREELVAEIEGLAQAGDIIVFASRNIAYSTIDNIGSSAQDYPASTKIIRVPTTTIVTAEMLDIAFYRGASHAVFVEEPPDNQIGEIIYPLAEARFFELKTEYGDRLHLKKAYIPHAKGLSDMFSSLEEVEE